MDVIQGDDVDTAGLKLTQALTLDWRSYLHQHRQTAWGFGLALLSLLALMLAGLWQVWMGDAQALRLGLLGSGIGFLATALGALPVLLLQRLSERLEDTLLGLGAGMMLAASFVSLLLPALHVGSTLGGHVLAGVLTVLLGMVLGVALMLGLDRFTPHEHAHSGQHGPSARLQRIWLFVLAIALHNLPEGMAVGVSFSQGDWSAGLPVALAIALQNLPEGLAVAIALRAIQVPALPAVAVAAATGLMEPVGALAGVVLASGLPWCYPLGLALAGGAMLFVVFHEVIPESHRNGHQTPATLGLMIGVLLMLGLDAGLG